ncbi:hypothetical protein ABXT21_22785, partial [Ralstonia sp. SM1864_UCD524_TZ4]|uniref:hypothetical protein n=1 Tax=Ralstonia pseudosolanacearum TaxID=1310165 RepID=UPI003393DF66
CQQQYDEQRDDDFLLQLHWRAFLLFKVDRLACCLVQPGAHLGCCIVLGASSAPADMPQWGDIAYFVDWTNNLSPHNRGEVRRDDRGRQASGRCAFLRISFAAGLF